MTSEKAQHKFQEVLDGLNDKYSHFLDISNRCASKIFDLQVYLRTNLIPFQLVLGIFDRHCLESTSTVSAAKLKQIVADIYYAASYFGYFSGSSLKVPSKKVLRSLIWNIFDPKGERGFVATLELKQTLIVLCRSTSFHSKILEFFDVIADHNRCILRTRFEEFLSTFVRILTYLDESANQFGSNWISSTVSKVYEHTPGLGGITNVQFIQLWADSSSNFCSIVKILSLAHRVNECQLVLHRKSCAGCHSSPIRGLRFKCLQCRGFSLCYKCFSMGFTTKKHGVLHQMIDVSSKVDHVSLRRRIVGFFLSLLKRPRSEKLAENAAPEVSVSQILTLCDSLADQNELFMSGCIEMRDKLSQSQIDLIDQQYHVLDRKIKTIREIAEANDPLPLFSSTPFRKNHPKLDLSVSTTFLSIRNGDQDSSYSINDISSWFKDERAIADPVLSQTVVDPRLSNFQRLLTQMAPFEDQSQIM